MCIIYIYIYIYIWREREREREMYMYAYTLRELFLREPGALPKDQIRLTFDKRGLIIRLVHQPKFGEY